MRRVALALVFVASSVVLPPAITFASGIVDQEQSVVPRLDAGDTIGQAANNVLAQVFTAGVSGQLTDADLPVVCGGTGTLTIEIRSTVAYSGRAVPGTGVLAAVSVAMNALPTADASGFRTFTFPTPASITAGSSYAIVASAPGSIYPDNCYLPEGPVGDSYSGGDAWFMNATQQSPSTPGGWLCLCDLSASPFDYPFRTRVAPQGADLGVAIVDSADPVFGTTQTYSYSVTLTNYGPASAPNAMARVTLSSNLIFLGVPGCTYVSPNVECSAPLGVTASTTFAIFVKASYGTTASATATAMNVIPDPNPSNNTATEWTTVTPVIDLELTGLTADPSPAGVGDNILYRAQVTNVGSYAATSAGALMALPANTTFDFVVGPTGSLCGFDPPTGMYGCNFGSLPTSASATMWFQVHGPTVATTISATARVFSTEPDSNGANDAKTISTQVQGEMVAQPVGPGGTATTDTGSGATAADPIETSVTSPSAGTITIREVPATGQLTGYNLLGQQVYITAPTASASNPLVLVFELDASILGGQTASTITILRNGVPIGSCPGQTVASPDPCVSDRTTLPNGNVRLTVLTSAASRWTFGIHTPFSFTGFYAPLGGGATAEAGSTLAVKFSLGGDQGLHVIADASSRPCTGGAGEKIAYSGRSIVRYDVSADQYVINWQTKREWAGTCRDLVLTLADGSVHSARVSFR